MYELIKVKELETLGNVALYIRSEREIPLFPVGKRGNEGGRGFLFHFENESLKRALKNSPLVKSKACSQNTIFNGE